MPDSVRYASGSVSATSPYELGEEEGNAREDVTAIYLTEKQAADRMGWSVRKLKGLRLTGKLPYIPGRPPMIDEADLQAYLTRVKQAAEERAKRPRSRAKPRPELSADEIARQRVNRRALLKWLRVQVRRERSRK